MSQPSQPVALVVGASRGIGRQVAIDLAKNGFKVVVAAKSVSDATKTSPFPPDPISKQSTITTVAHEIREAGGEATAIQVDTRSPESIKNMIESTVKMYGSLDVLIYNSGAIWWSSVEKTPLKRFQLLSSVNMEGLYATVQAAFPYFERNGWKGRIIVVSPPIYSRFFRGKTAYAMGKVAMSVFTKGLAMDWRREGKKEMAITSIWPAVGIQSAATPDPELLSELRTPTIFSDAILEMLRTPPEQISGCLELDEDFLRKKGVTDFSKYSVVPGANPRRMLPATLPVLTVPEEDEEVFRVDSTNCISEHEYMTQRHKALQKYADLCISTPDNETPEVLNLNLETLIPFRMPNLCRFVQSSAAPTTQKAIAAYNKPRESAKKWITNGQFANYFITGCKTRRGFSVLHIPRSEGVTTKTSKTSYSATAGTAYVQFDKVMVPVDHVFGKEHQGFTVVMSNFNNGRFAMICGSIRGTRGTVEECLKWCDQRIVFKRSLVDQPAIRSKLAKMIASVEPAQAWLEQITEQMVKMSYIEQATHLGGHLALLKPFTTRVAHEVADEAVNIFGGRALIQLV
ncbi:hypothetical protein QWA68_015688 [Fusarium oxysporum]|nr:hypothetical protein QWA68_015688 [Fusarium oxysporum]